MMTERIADLLGMNRGIPTEEVLAGMRQSKPPGARHRGNAKRAAEQIGERISLELPWEEATVHSARPVSISREAWNVLKEDHSRI